MSDSEFGPWIAHDGNGCPVIGQVARVEYNDPNKTVQEHLIKGNPRSWVWDHEPKRWYKIIRYRIKKPRGLTLLEETLKEVNDTHPLKVKEFDPCRSQRSPSQFGV